MKAVKENRVYTIPETEQDYYNAKGFDIMDDNGEVIAYGRGKTVSYEEYARVVKELKELKENKSAKKTKEPAENKTEE
jgi:hypothetical protein